MIYADFDYYKNEFHGIVIQSAEDYGYFAEMAGDELAIFANRIPNTDEAQTALKRCACRVADIVYGDFKSTKFGVGGGKLTSESVSGYYSASYNHENSANGTSQMRRQINTAVALLLGKWVLGARKVKM